MRVVIPVALTWAAFAFYLLPGAADHEVASGSVLSGRGQVRNSEATIGGPRSESTYQGKTARWWARRAVQARKDANARGHTIRRLQHAQLTASAHFFNWLAAADCVHSKESIHWNAHTGNGYYGGMQADTSFQRAYAPDLIRRYGGWAHTWPWYAQLQMAYRGWLFRGWAPWPNTARRCGLL